jgi:hypothetical protein
MWIGVSPRERVGARAESMRKRFAKVDVVLREDGLVLLQVLPSLLLPTENLKSGDGDEAVGGASWRRARRATVATAAKRASSSEGGLNSSEGTGCNRGEGGGTGAAG